MGEKWPVKFSHTIQFPCNCWVLLTCRKAATWDRRLYFPSEGRHGEDFVASAGFEPVNFGTRGQHANH
jgi:hypothetical protein